MSQRPLADAEVVGTVRLLDSVPPEMPEPMASMVRATFDRLQAHPGAAATIAVWPDGTWAILGHNPDWSQPRPTQLIRAYRTAHAAGIRIPCAKVSAKES